MNLQEEYYRLPRRLTTSDDQGPHCTDNRRNSCCSNLTQPTGRSRMYVWNEAIFVFTQQHSNAAHQHTHQQTPFQQYTRRRARVSTRLSQTTRTEAEVTQSDKQTNSQAGIIGKGTTSEEVRAHS